MAVYCSVWSDQGGLEALAGRGGQPKGVAGGEGAVEEGEAGEVGHGPLQEARGERGEVGPGKLEAPHPAGGLTEGP